MCHCWVCCDAGFVCCWFCLAGVCLISAWCLYGVWWFVLLFCLGGVFFIWRGRLWFVLFGTVLVFVSFEFGFWVFNFGCLWLLMLVLC